MTVLLRFRGLKERGIVNSWPQLKRLQTEQNFPLGRMLSPNVRAWLLSEIDEWLATRPVENPRLQGVGTPEGQAKARVTKARRKAAKARLEPAE